MTGLTARREDAIADAMLDCDHNGLRCYEPMPTSEAAQLAVTRENEVLAPVFAAIRSCVEIAQAHQPATVGDLLTADVRALLGMDDPK